MLENYSLKSQEAFFESLKKEPARGAVLKFYEYISGMPEGVALNTIWRDFWSKHERFAHRIIPGPVFQEIQDKIQSIAGIDEDIWKISMLKGTKVAFLIGAGISAPSGIPTVDKLLPELWKKARKIGRDDLDRLSNWCNERGITNIEDLLTAAYLSDFSAKKPGITSLLDYFLFARGRELHEEEVFMGKYHRGSEGGSTDIASISFIQDTLQTLFGLLTSTMITASPNPAHTAIVNLLKERDNVSIITTNYDGCMDEAIIDAGIHACTLAGTEAESTEGKRVDLVKMHGSINWTYCESCHDIRSFDLLEMKRIYHKDTLSYPVMGLCKKCGGLRRPLIVPPLSFKFLLFPNLIDIWNSARIHIEEAEYLFVVGYSFSEADTYITKIISRSISMNESQKMIVVDTNPALVPTLRNRFSAHIDGFDRSRVYQACEKCDVILPKIVDSILKSHDKL